MVEDPLIDSLEKKEPDLLSLKRNAFWHLWKRRALLIIALLILLIPLYGTFEPLLSSCSLQYPWLP